MSRNAIITTIIVVALIGIVIFFGKSGITGEDVEIDTTGIHIMSDGTVMLGNGEMVADAEVTQDGMIKLPNGEIVAPVKDMR